MVPVEHFGKALAVLHQFRLCALIMVPAAYALTERSALALTLPLTWLALCMLLQELHVHAPVSCYICLTYPCCELHRRQLLLAINVCRVYAYVCTYVYLHMAYSALHGVACRSSHYVCKNYA